MSVFRALQQLGAWLNWMHQLMRVIAAELQLQPGRRFCVLCRAVLLALYCFISLSIFLALSFFISLSFLPLYTFLYLCPFRPFSYLSLPSSFCPSPSFSNLLSNFNLVYALYSIFSSYTHDLPSHSLTHLSWCLYDLYLSFFIDRLKSINAIFFFLQGIYQSHFKLPLSVSL